MSWRFRESNTEIKAKIISAEEYNFRIFVENVETKEKREYRLRDTVLLDLAVLFRGKVVDLIVEGDEVKDIRGYAEVVIYGVKYSDIKEELPSGTRKLGLADILGDIFVGLGDWFLFVIFVASLIMAMIYVTLLLPMVYLVASIFTLGESWRMRHKLRLLVLVNRENIGAIKSLSRKIVNRKGAIRAPKILIDDIIEDNNKALSRSFMLLDAGKYLLGFAIVLLAIYATIYVITNKTFVGILNALVETAFWMIPAVLGALGFMLIIIAGFHHRIIKLDVARD